MQTKAIYTPEQVAELLQVDVTTVYRYIKEGKLVASKLGRTYRILKEDVDLLLTLTSTGEVARQRLFERVAKIAERNRAIPLEEIEQDVGEAVKAVRKTGRR
ncbi:MAG: helix-turn-helix domain-containing protein [Candidatus Methylomirabilales bacterium]